ncbi:hypothetical protein PCE1_002539 [Barthelona sp. PCE]
MEESASIIFKSISFSHSIKLPLGVLKFTPEAFGFKSRNHTEAQLYDIGEVVEFSVGQLFNMKYRIRVSMKDEELLIFDGLTEENVDAFKKFAAKYFYHEQENTRIQIPVVAFEMCFDGCNYGRVAVDGAGWHFVSAEALKNYFSVPMTFVNSIKPSGQDVDIQFDIQEQEERGFKGDLLSSMRMHIPTEDNIQVFHNFVADLAAEKEMAIPERKKNHAADFAEYLLNTTDLTGTSSNILCRFEKIKCLMPRANYDCQLYPDYIRLTTATQSFRLPWNQIGALFLCRQERKAYFCISLRRELRQGKTNYNWLIFQFSDGDLTENNTYKLNLTEEECQSKYTLLKPEYANIVRSDAFCSIVQGLAKKKVHKSYSLPGFDPSQFYHGIELTLKANQGQLFIMEQACLYLFKPYPLYIAFSKIESVEFLRMGTTSNFDMLVHADEDYEFTGIDKSMADAIQAAFENNRITVSNPEETLKQQIIADENEESDSEDEDFQIDLDDEDAMEDEALNEAFEAQYQKKRTAANTNMPGEKEERGEIDAKEEEN